MVPLFITTVRVADANHRIRQRAVDGRLDVGIGIGDAEVAQPSLVAGYLRREQLADPDAVGQPIPDHQSSPASSARTSPARWSTAAPCSFA